MRAIAATVVALACGVGILAMQGPVFRDGIDLVDTLTEADDMTLVDVDAEVRIWRLARRPPARVR